MQGLPALVLQLWGDSCFEHLRGVRRPVGTHMGNAQAKKRKLHIDIAKEVELITLGALKAQFWPRSQVFDNLTFEVASLKDRGVPEPFLYVELISRKQHWLMDGNDDPFVRRAVCV